MFCNSPGRASFPGSALISFSRSCVIASFWGCLVKVNRREFLKMAGALAVVSREALAAPREAGLLVNDIHSRLNPTHVDRIVPVHSMNELRDVLQVARRDRKSVSISGGRHAMGGQQFGAGTTLLDMRKLNRVLGLDSASGILEVEAGIQWPELIDQCLKRQKGAAQQWGIAQKQTGADRMTIGGTLAANAHGRGLRFKPIVGDVESFALMDAAGEVHTCSRAQNPELFRLAIGGYGLFGIIMSAKLRLTPRRKVERVVEVFDVEDLIPAFERRITDGFLYGDFQFSVDEASRDFLRKGVFSCYKPVSGATPVAETQKELADSDWRELLYLAHAHKSKAFSRYAAYYLSTNGQTYWSDTHQLSIYPDGYHRPLDRRLGAKAGATEMITEIYVPRARLVDFLEEARAELRRNAVSVIYGTIRLIERDDESFLAWARQPYACIIFNLHTVHTRKGREHSAAAFRRLIDMGISRGGSYFLTYHRYATRHQVEACYPQFPDFLRLKKKYDPEERFQSDWYRHCRRMFADVF